jgi:hypothetical protein
MRVEVTRVSANRGDDARRTARGFKNRTLLDVQLEVGRDPRWVEERLAAPYFLHRRTAGGHRLCEVSRAITTHACQVRLGESPEERARSEITLAVPGALLASQSVHTNIAVRAGPRATQAPEHLNAGQDAGGAVEVSPLRN